MKCADCIHYDVCHYQDIVPINENDEETDTCFLFADKSRFVELPCNNNDTVYVLYEDGRIAKEEVIYFTVYEDSIGITTDGIYDGVWEEDIFLTREEAENALERRKECCR